MAHCENCGTKLSDGTCPNCEEELFIAETQVEDIDEVSDEFWMKVKTQMEARQERRAELRSKH